MPQPPGQAPARYLGLDLGDRRIGIAISDELGLTAQPILTLTRRPGRQALHSDLKSIARLARRYHCSAIVAGNPLYMSGDLSPQAAKAHDFSRLIHEQTGLPVYLWDERLSTTEAHRHLHSAGLPKTSHRPVIDQVAAVLILQSFLDALPNHTPVPFLPGI